MLFIYGIYPVVGDNGTIPGCIGAEGVLLKFSFRGSSTCIWNGATGTETYASTISYLSCVSKEAIGRVNYYSKVGSLDCADQHGVQYWGQTSGGNNHYVESKAWTLDSTVWSENGNNLGMAQDCYKLNVHSTLRDDDELASYPVTMRFNIRQYDPITDYQYDYTVLEQPFRVRIADAKTTQNYQTDYIVSLYIPLKSPTGYQDIDIEFEYLGWNGSVEIICETVGFWLNIHIFCLFTLQVGYFKQECETNTSMTGPTVKGSITKTWYCRSVVGGIWVPVDKFGLLAPYIGLASTIIVATAATAIYAKRVKRREKNR